MWVNGFNLGWYWPLKGPQMTTYVPGPLLRAGANKIVVLEFLCAPIDLAGAFTCAKPVKCTHPYLTTVGCQQKKVSGNYHAWLPADCTEQVLASYLASGLHWSKF